MFLFVIREHKGQKKEDAIDANEAQKLELAKKEKRREEKDRDEEQRAINQLKQTLKGKSKAD